MGVVGCVPASLDGIVGTGEFLLDASGCWCTAVVSWVLARDHGVGKRAAGLAVG